jgi:4-alpha-glucanotransferase
MKKETSQRIAGILMPLASLPSDEGIGCLGADSYHFVDLLEAMGIRVWQLLPLTPLGYGNSPYQPFASCAGDPLYISLSQLVRDGLLSADEIPAPGACGGRIDYHHHRRSSSKTWRNQA